MKKIKISKRTVDELTPETVEYWAWDVDLKGFFVRVRPNGKKVYAVKYRIARQQRVLTIGAHGPYTPEAARKAAEAALRDAAAGLDPAAEKQKAKDALTVGALIDAYLLDGPATKPAKRASTWEIDASNLNRHIRKLLGTRIADSLTKADAARAIRDIANGKTAADEKTGLRGRAIIKGGEGTARRTRTTAAAMFSWGVEHGLTKGNPFEGVKLTTAPVRERFLSRDEAGRFLDALTDLESEHAIASAFADALRLLLLTGARKTEVLGLRWEEVSLNQAIITLPPERTKAGGKTGVRRIMLSAPALEILNRRRAQLGADSLYVFPAHRGDSHAVGLRKPFLAACARAGLDGIRVHDLRHSFASFAVADGMSLYLIGKVLGHASARTTERYAHLSGDPLRDVAEQVGKRLARPTKDDESRAAEVILIKR